jgi:hypothetical protein
MVTLDVNTGDLGDLLTGIGTLVVAAAAVPALAGIRRARRAEAAQRLEQIFREFYAEDRLKECRLMLEYKFDEIAPLLVRRMVDRSAEVPDEDQKKLEQIDTLLKYLEFILHLEAKGLLKKRDRAVLLDYWFDLLRKPNKAPLRRYVDFFGWYRLAGLLNARQPRGTGRGLRDWARRTLSERGSLRLANLLHLAEPGANDETVQQLPAGVAANIRLSQEARSPLASPEWLAAPDEQRAAVEQLGNAVRPAGEARLDSGAVQGTRVLLYVTDSMTALHALPNLSKKLPRSAAAADRVRVTQLRDSSGRPIDTWHTD